ncbi:U3 small nucleolar RNA-associated protein 13 [Acrasis kona]|uniref:U3 small nucleolar RNA-associated protein 13 n=1 Tax=Acrasis kona TaxID=1008807 RepID=A0AAW2ZEB9_9EUKA
MAYNPKSDLILMAHGNSSLRIYDLNKGAFTHHFGDFHTGRINLVRWHQNGNIFFSNALDGFRVWNLKAKECIAHLNQDRNDVTEVICGEQSFITSGHNILQIYDSYDFKLLKSIPILESVTSMARYPSESFQVITSSSSSDEHEEEQRSGSIKIWDVDSGELIKTSGEEMNTSYQQIGLCEKHNEIMAVTADNNFLFYEMDTLTRTRQILGFNDEVLDACFLGEKSIAVATNSDNVLIMNLDNKSTEFLSGHRDIILGVCSLNDNVVISASKDKSVRVWRDNKCVASGSHTGSISAICASAKTKSFFVTGSDDKTIKVWSTKFPKYEEKFGDERDIASIIPMCSSIAHTKEISNISISPDEKLIATASADKTCKIWSLNADHNALQLETTLTHNRAVWSVAFSPIEKCVATACSDKKIRIWNLNGKCLKVLDGHQTSVVKVAFINKGLQLVSSDANGLVKIWNIKSSEVLDTFDHHSARIWALVVRDDGKVMITGGEDSRINIWKDWTEGVIQEKRQLVDQTVKQEQELDQMIRSGKFLDAIILSISTDRPKKTFTLLEKLFETDRAQSELANILNTLSSEEMTILFQFAIDWNTNSKFSSVAQKVLHGMLTCLDPNFINISYEKSVQAILAYSERHFKRVSSLLENSHLLDYMLSTMRTAPIPTQKEVDDDDQEEEDDDDEDEQPPTKKIKV